MTVPLFKLSVTRIFYEKEKKKKKKEKKKKKKGGGGGKNKFLVEKKMTGRLAHGRLFCDVFPSGRNENVRLHQPLLSTCHSQPPETTIARTGHRNRSHLTQPGHC